MDRHDYNILTTPLQGGEDNNYTLHLNVKYPSTGQILHNTQRIHQK